MTRALRLAQARYARRLAAEAAGRRIAAESARRLPPGAFAGCPPDCVSCRPRTAPATPGRSRFTVCPVCGVARAEHAAVMRTRTP